MKSYDNVSGRVDAYCYNPPDCVVETPTRWRQNKAGANTFALEPVPAFESQLCVYCSVLTSLSLSVLI